MDTPLHGLLNSYLQSSGIRAYLRVGSWIDGWSSLYGYALSRSGPDVSEVGSTWVGDLVRMGALGAFSKSEVASIVGDAPFIEKMWVMRQQDGSCYSIPWSSDLRMIFYRRDLLDQAGIDETTAFQDMPHFEETLACLRESTGLGPLAIPTIRSRNALQVMATWVWSAGGDFLCADDNGICFDQPQALAGVRAFFNLKPYLCASAYQLKYRADQTITSGQAAVLLSGSWVLKQLMITPDAAQTIGVAALPGPAFVGGSHLVFWDYSRQRELALGLIRFLHESENIPAVYPWIGLPVRESAWAQKPFSEYPFSTMLELLKNGRPFSASQSWGLVEKRLIDTITVAWERLLAPEPENHVEIEQSLIDLAARLRPLLEAQ